jgi:WD40 repeat protein
MMNRVHGMFRIFVILMLLINALGCDFIKKVISSSNKDIESAYLEYREALMDGDISLIKKRIVSRNLHEFDGEDAEIKIELIRELYPVNISVDTITKDNNTATLEAFAEVEGGIIKGIVHLEKEDGDWKISEEQWDMTVRPHPIVLTRGDNAPSFEPIDTSPVSPGQLYGLASSPFLKKPLLPSRVILSGHQDEVTGLIFSPDPNFLISSSYGDFTLRVWDIPSGNEIQKIRLDHRPLSIDIVPDTPSLIVTDVYGTLILFPFFEGNIGTPEIISSELGHNASVSVSPNGNLCATASFDRFILIFDLTKKRLLRRISTEDPMRSVAFSPSGEILAAGTTTNKILLWKVQEGKGRTYTISKVDPQSDVSSLSFSPSGKLLATGHMDSSITVWDVEKQEEIHNFYVPNASTWAVRFTPDGKILASGNQDGFIYLWDSSSARKITVLKGHDAAVRALAFSPDGSILASGGEDRKIIIWK